MAILNEPAANDRGPVADLDVPPDPTDVHEHRQPYRPRRGELHGADDPWGWADNRGATLRTVRRTP